MVSLKSFSTVIYANKNGMEEKRVIKIDKSTFSIAQSEKKKFEKM